jgi:thioredoxin reductase
VVLATGHDVPLDIPGLAERWGRCVFHCPFCHGYETNGKALAVVANGFDSVLAGYVADRTAVTSCCAPTAPPSCRMR